jgi:regulatory protein
MKITGISQQASSNNRVNVMVDGAYRFSLDIFQVGELGLRVGKEYSEKELVELEEESVFGKTYARALEYTMLRPHSVKEVRDYLWRKTRDTKVRNKKTGEVIARKGISQSVADRVLERLVEKGYLDDSKFARFWIDNRNQRKGTSIKKLEMELRSKGVSTEVIRENMQKSTRDEKSELKKMIEKKAKKYADMQKLTVYLVRQGFLYDDVKIAVDEYVTSQYDI